MESGKREKAIKAKQTALEKMENNDFTTARKHAARAQELCPDIENIEQMILVCDVHAATRFCEGERDWYKIINIDPTADMASIRKQCHQMTLSLHPDKNRFPGAGNAFQLVCQAKAVLTDRDKRRLFDSRRNAQGFTWFQDQQNRNIKGLKKEVNKLLNRASKKQKQSEKIPNAGNKRGENSKEIQNPGKDLQFTGNSACGPERHLENLEKTLNPGKTSQFQFPGNLAFGSGQNPENLEKILNPGKFCQFPGTLAFRPEQNREDLEKILNPGKNCHFQFPRNLAFTPEQNSENLEKILNLGKNCQFPGTLASGPEQSQEYLEKIPNPGKNCQFQSPETSASGPKQNLENLENILNPGKTCQFPGTLAFGPERNLENLEKIMNSGKNCQFSGTSSSGPEQNLENLEYSDAAFNDFEGGRAKRNFSSGQIWAIYDTLDAMPRFYALIDKVVSEDFEVQITWLEPCPDNEEERKWLYQGLPSSCGKFRPGNSELIQDHGIFSHLAAWKMGIDLGKIIYEIYPRKGETWAIFKNRGMDWNCDPGRRRPYDFEVVEILSDYGCDGDGASVALLWKMEEFSSIFSRINGQGMECGVMKVKERLRFSHRVISFQMSIDEGENGAKRFFELDPASLPAKFP